MKIFAHVKLHNTAMHLILLLQHPQAPAITGPKVKCYRCDEIVTSDKTNETTAIKLSTKLQVRCMYDI